MSRFFGSIQGSRGMATRLGGKRSGIRGHVRGWAIGARAFCDVNAEGEDVVTVYITGGSNGASSETRIGSWKRVLGELVKVD